jgi:hypothetical protein
MKLADRLNWLTDAIKRYQTHDAVNVLNSAFVDEYTEATGAKFEPVMWGANKCPQLGRDLKALYDQRLVYRFRVGLSGNWQPGFPKWVFSYRLRGEGV